MFEVMLPVILAYAHKCFGNDPIKVGDAVTFAWWAWFTAKPEQRQLPPSVWARAGVRRVNSRRDLPGIETGRQWGGDPLERADTWTCGRMNDVLERSPGPDQLVISRETLANLRAIANDAQRRMIDLIAADQTLGTAELSRLLGRSPSRISQLRREIADLLDE